MRYQFPGYQLNLDDLKEFIRFTEQSGYLIKKLHLTGPGEPLLWRHFKEGAKLLRASPAVEKIVVITNGLNLSRLDLETWDNIDRVDINVYPPFQKWDQLDRAVSSHGEKIRINPANRFLETPAKGETAAIPCICDCAGPMYFDRKIFFYCGPPVFGAAESKGVSVLDYPEMYAEIGLNYLDQSRPEKYALDDSSQYAFVETDQEADKIGNHDLCRYCFANRNFVLREHDHIAFVKSDTAQPKLGQARQSSAYPWRRVEEAQCAADILKITGIEELPVFGRSLSGPDKWELLQGLNVETIEGRAAIAGQPIFRLVAVGAGSSHALGARFAGLTTGQVYRAAVWVKAEPGMRVMLEAYGDTGSCKLSGRCASQFHPATSTTLTSAGRIFGSGVEAAGDNWRKIWIGLCSDDGNALVIITLLSGSNDGKLFRDVFEADRQEIIVGGFEISPPRIPSKTIGSVIGSAVRGLRVALGF